MEEKTKFAYVDHSEEVSIERAEAIIENMAHKGMEVRYAKDVKRYGKNYIRMDFVEPQYSPHHGIPCGDCGNEDFTIFHEWNTEKQCWHDTQYCPCGKETGYYNGEVCYESLDRAHNNEEQEVERSGVMYDRTLCLNCGRAIDIPQPTDPEPEPETEEPTEN